MRETYKRIGDYIKLIKVKNSDNLYSELNGININKFFMPSVANIVDVDLSKYKIVNKHQFACNRMHLGRDLRIPVALSEKEVPFLVSPAYDVFEIKNQSLLIPEFLMMWFSRKEFDRNAWFYTDADVRGGLAWEAFCNIPIPIPSIAKQREIVAEYQAIEQRIQINQKLIEKLEETAQAIYREWFVEFEFPDENGKPYKSSGGKMVWCEELGKEIPEGWEMCYLDDIVDAFISKRGKSKSTMNLQSYSKEYRFPVISAMNINNGRIVKYDLIPFVDFKDYSEWMNPKLEIDDVIVTSEAPLGETYYISMNSNLALGQRLFALRTKKDKASGWFLYLWLNTPIAKQELEGRSSGTTVFGIKLSELKKVSLLIPNIKIESIFYESTISIAKLIEVKNQENQKLSELKALLLSRLATVGN